MNNKQRCLGIAPLMNNETQTMKEAQRISKNFFLANPESGMADLMKWLIDEGQHTELGHALARGLMQARSIQGISAKGQYSFK